jgi:hypothetical protein
LPTFWGLCKFNGGIWTMKSALFDSHFTQFSTREQTWSMYLFKEDTVSYLGTSKSLCSKCTDICHSSTKKTSCSLLKTFEKG